MSEKDKAQGEPEFSESGQPIYRHQDREREWRPPASVDEATAAALEAHRARFLSSEGMVWHEIVSDLVHIDVYHYPPALGRDYHVLVTEGMSALPMEPPPGLPDARLAELYMCLPPEWPVSQEAFEDEANYWPIRWLKLLARLPHEYETWLWEEHTVPNGDPPEPFADNTKLCGVILLPSRLLPAGFSSLELEPGRTVRLFGVVPLYQEEMDLKLRKGVSALLPGLDKHGVTELLDPNRKNVAKRGGLFGLFN